MESFLLSWGLCLCDSPIGEASGSCRSDSGCGVLHVGSPLLCKFHPDPLSVGPGKCNQPVLWFSRNLMSSSSRKGSCVAPNQTMCCSLGSWAFLERWAFSYLRAFSLAIPSDPRQLCGLCPQLERLVIAAEASPSPSTWTFSQARPTIHTPRASPPRWSFTSPRYSWLACSGLTWALCLYLRV